MRILKTSLISVAFALPLLLHAQPALQALAEDQIEQAIALGRAGNVPIVEVGTFLGSSRGSFKVFIESPVARIAAAAAKAFKAYRPFGLNDVTDAMKSPLYRAFVERQPGSSAGAVEHIVLQPRGAKGLDDVVQPVREPRPGITEAFFDRFPDGEFDVVVATSKGAQRYTVSLKDRSAIERLPRATIPSGRSSTPIDPSLRPSAPASAASPVSSASGKTLALRVQGDGKHAAEAIDALQTALDSAGITARLVKANEAYDYLVVFGEGERQAAAAFALDANGSVVALVVRATFTEKGAAEAAARELAKQLAARSR